MKIAGMIILSLAVALVLMIVIGGLCFWVGINKVKSKKKPKLYVAWMFGVLPVTIAASTFLWAYFFGKYAIAYGIMAAISGYVSALYVAGGDDSKKI